MTSPVNYGTILRMRTITVHLMDGETRDLTVPTSTRHIIFTRTRVGRGFVPVTGKTLIPKLTKLAAQGCQPVAYPIVHGKVQEN